MHPGDSPPPPDVGGRFSLALPPAPVSSGLPVRLLAAEDTQSGESAPRQARHTRISAPQARQASLRAVSALASEQGFDASSASALHVLTDMLGEVFRQMALLTHENFAQAAHRDRPVLHDGFAALWDLGGPLAPPRLKDYARLRGARAGRSDRSWAALSSSASPKASEVSSLVPVGPRVPAPVRLAPVPDAPSVPIWADPTVGFLSFEGELGPEPPVETSKEEVPVLGKPGTLKSATLPRPPFPPGYTYRRPSQVGSAARTAFGDGGGPDSDARGDTDQEPSSITSALSGTRPPSALIAVERAWTKSQLTQTSLKSLIRRIDAATQGVPLDADPDVSPRQPKTLPLPTGMAAHTSRVAAGRERRLHMLPPLHLPTDDAESISSPSLVPSASLPPVHNVPPSSVQPATASATNVMTSQTLPLAADTTDQATARTRGSFTGPSSAPPHGHAFTSDDAPQRKKVKLSIPNLPSNTGAEEGTAGNDTKMSLRAREALYSPGAKQLVARAGLSIVPPSAQAGLVDEPNGTSPQASVAGRSNGHPVSLVAGGKVGSRSPFAFPPPSPVSKEFVRAWQASQQDGAGAPTGTAASSVPPSTSTLTARDFGPDTAPPPSAPLTPSDVGGPVHELSPASLPGVVNFKATWYAPTSRRSRRLRHRSLPRSGSGAGGKSQSPGAPPGHVAG